MRSRLLFPLYLTAVIGGGGAVAVAAAFGAGAGASVTEHLGTFVALAGLLLVGELRPLRLFRVSRLTQESSPLLGSASTTFVFALVLLFGLPATLCVHAVASLVDDVVRRRSPEKMAFNVAQYALSLGAAAWVLSAAGWPLADEHFGLGDIGPTVGAALAYFLINNFLVGTVIALSSGRSAARTVVEELRRCAAMESFLLGLGPLAAVLGIVSPLLLPLLLLPTLTTFVASRSIREIDRRAKTDALTGLPNRLGFHDVVAETLDGLGRGAVVLLDLDRFKEVNDTLGHVVGDQLLVEIGQRLADEFGEGAVVGRLGGDEFVVFDPAVSEEDHARELAERALECLDAPYEVDRLDLAIEASAGIAVAPHHGTTPDELLQRAEVAMYLAKSSPGQLSSYDPARDLHSRRRLQLLGELRSAIAEGQLVLHFQPQAELATGEVVGLEALLRWDHPELGLVLPDEFVPLAEHSALIGPLSSWVLEASVLEARRQLDQGRLLRMSVNISSRTLHDLALPVEVAELLQHHGVPAGLLTVELTESAAADLGPASKVLNALATMGITIAIDDFGTGYSSLTYLKNLPVSEVKIDRSFVAGVERDSYDEAIVRSTVQLAQNLNLVTVAEGVEAEATAEILRRMGCNRVQGYLLGQAMSGAELDEWFARRDATLQA